MPVFARTSARCTLAPTYCCICRSTDAQLVATGQDYEYETTADLFHVVRCNSCGLHFLNPRPAPEELRLIYPEDYYSYNYNEAVHPVARTAKAWLDARKAKQWLHELGKQNPRVLDVGCGDGRYLRLFHSWGIPKDQLWGTELDAGIVRQLQGEGFSVREGPIESIPELPGRYFDLITLLQIIEHVSDPHAVLVGLRDLLAPGGLLVIETPNIDSLDFRLFRSGYWGGYHFPRHWHFFNPRTLRRLLEAADLVAVRLRYLPAHTFWLYSFHHVVKYGWGFRRLARLLDPLKNIPLLTLATTFDWLRATFGFRTSNMQLLVRKRACGHRP